MIKEIKISDPITYEGQPDGEKVPMIDPYDGCQLNCPYCWQLSNQDWNKSIFVNTNIADLLKNRLNLWNKEDEIYLGSRCDPYMPIEEKYGLTRKCLQVLNELEINTMITTKSDNNLIFRDVDILKNFSAEMTVLMGMTNINQIGKGINNDNILTANKLFDNCVSTWAFITPILPYIMDIDAIIAALNPGIPVFLDKLRIKSDTVQAENMMRFIKRDFPEYTKQYDEIINGNDELYYTELIDKYADDSRIKILFSD